MSRFLLKTPRHTSHEGDLGMGMISIFALIVILCMAVLSVLAFATAHSSLVLSQRQAASTQELYANEAAAQTFVAGLDEISGGSPAAADLEALCTEAEQATGGLVTAEATAEDGGVRAQFACEGGRTLKVELTLLPGGGYRVDSWRMAAVEMQEQPMGTLYSSN